MALLVLFLLTLMFHPSDNKERTGAEKHPRGLVDEIKVIVESCKKPDIQ